MCLSWVCCPAVSPRLSDAPWRPSEKLRFSCKARAGTSFESAAEARATGVSHAGGRASPGAARSTARAQQSWTAGTLQFHLRASPGERSTARVA